MGDQLGGGSRAADLHPFQFFQSWIPVFLGVENARAMTMKIHHLDIIQFFGLKFIIKGIAQTGGLITCFISQGHIDDLHEGEPAGRITENRHADVRYPFDHAVVTLIGRRQGGPGKHGDLYRSIGPFFNLFGPFGGQNGVGMGSGEKNGIGKGNGFGLGMTDPGQKKGKNKKASD